MYTVCVYIYIYIYCICSVICHLPWYTQELFTLFGLPYLVAPGEAEAQCAYLETSGQVEGVLTDDNDALLFGAQAVYRGFFSQDRDPELYNYTDIQETLGKNVS